MRLTSWIALAVVLAACGGGPVAPDDAGTDGGLRCEGIPPCTEGRACDGDTLVSCAPDADGCLVETRTDCAAMESTCEGTGASTMCSGLPCAGVPAASLCETAGSSCEGNRAVSCAPNAQGCLVRTVSYCAPTGDVCGIRDGAAVCDGACSFRTVCPDARYCESQVAVSCRRDADGCLVEVSREECIDGLCTARGFCTASCPGVAPTVLTCASGTLTESTAGATAAIGRYSCTSDTDYAGPERIFIFYDEGTDRHEVTIAASSTTPDDYDLFVLDGGSGSETCNDASSCVDASQTSTANEEVRFSSGRGSVHFVVFDRHGAGGTSPADLELAVSCAPIVCGDGVMRGDEACDDAGTIDGDGCSASCEIERGYFCTGSPSACVRPCGDGVVDPTRETCDDANLTARDGCSDLCEIELGYTCTGQPSTCVFPSSNPTCATALAIAPSTASPFSIRGNLGTGGAPPSGTDCGATTGRALYYAVELPASTMVRITGNLDTATELALQRLTACTGTTCLDPTDPRSLLLLNRTASTTSQLVMARTRSDAGAGVFDLEVAYFALVAETEPNDDGSPSTGGATIVGNDIDATAVTRADARGAVTGDAVVSAALSPAGDEDLYAVSNTGTAPASVTLRTGAPTLGTCPTADTGLRVLTTGLTAVGSDDDGGDALCSQLTVSIPAGTTYYVAVTEYGDNAAVPAYELEIDFN